MRKETILLGVVIGLGVKASPPSAQIPCLFEGPVYTAVAGGFVGDGFAVQFTPASLPIQLDSVGIYILSEGDSLWGWPDSIHQEFLISVYGDGGGMPGAELFADTVQADSLPPNWVIAYPNLMISSGDFWVASLQLTPFPFCEGVGVDSLCDYPDLNWWRYLGTWLPLFPKAGDLMICAYFTATGVEEGSNFRFPIVDFRLIQNEPNPFHHSTLITYTIPGIRGQGSGVSERVKIPVRLTIYDITGRLVETLVNESQESGVYRVQWDAKGLSSGIYYSRLSARIEQDKLNPYTQTRKIILLR